MKTIKTLGILVALLALVATMWPILDTAPRPGQLERVVAVTGESVELLGYGPYRNMPKDLAIQGFAQDWITLLLAIPLLLVAMVFLDLQYPRSRVFAAGVGGYFLVQYTMYLLMAAYNELFLVWTSLLGLGFHLFLRLILPFVRGEIGVGAPASPRSRAYLGWFLVVNGILMALLWFGVILGPLFDGSFYPQDLQHLTTAVVQGIDLAIFLPPSILSGVWYLRGRETGLWLAPIYAVFLTMQMIALLAKIVGMSLQGASAGPALVFIPLLGIGALVGAIRGLRGLTGIEKVRSENYGRQK